MAERLVAASAIAPMRVESDGIVKRAMSSTERGKEIP
jgi:hypothetical protein